MNVYTSAASTAVAAGPDWATIVTAIGTVAVAIVAVGVALFAERRADKRLVDERAHSAAQLAEEQKRSAAAITEERRIAKELEQFAEAHAVQISAGIMRGTQPDQEDLWIDKDGTVAPAAVVINHGRYTITGIVAGFADKESGDLARATAVIRGAPSSLPSAMTEDLTALAITGDNTDTLTPWDSGLCFIGEFKPVTSDFLKFFPAVSWTDRWGTRWMHSRGRVLQLQDSEEGVPEDDGHPSE